MNSPGLWDSREGYLPRWLTTDVLYDPPAVKCLPSTGYSPSSLVNIPRSSLHPYGPVNPWCMNDITRTEQGICGNGHPRSTGKEKSLSGYGSGTVPVRQYYNSYIPGTYGPVIAPGFGISIHYKPAMDGHCIHYAYPDERIGYKENSQPGFLIDLMIYWRFSQEV